MLDAYVSDGYLADGGVGGAELLLHGEVFDVCGHEPFDFSDLLSHVGVSISLHFLGSDKFIPYVPGLIVDGNRNRATVPI